MYDVEEFWKFDLRVGKIVGAERVPGSRKLIRLDVDFGDESRVVVTGIADQVSPEQLLGKKMIFVLNLKPKKVMGVESQGMLLLAEEESGRIHLIEVPDEVPQGTKVW